jgi:hypothetical protein
VSGVALYKDHLNYGNTKWYSYVSGPSMGHPIGEDYVQATAALEVLTSAVAPAETYAYLG